MIAIIDYDIGNLAAVANMLHRLGETCEVTANPAIIGRAERLILPGNGAFDACMNNLRATGLVPLLAHRVLQEGVSLLGICVGAQMLGLGSEEGVESGLGWLDMQVRKLPDLPGLHVPHIGWNEVRPRLEAHPLTHDMEADSRFYFVHGYYMVPENKQDVLMTAHYGIDFAAGVVRGNIAGVQFHPEKSHRFGKRLLGNFATAA